MLLGPSSSVPGGISPTPSLPISVPRAGPSARALGTAAAEAEAAAINQQREVGGDPGGGGCQDGRVPWATTSGELCADDHEHGEVATIAAREGGGKGGDIEMGHRGRYG